MQMTLSIAVQLVSGHADYLVKVGRLIFGIFLAQADCTPHTHLTTCSVLTIWFWRTNVLVSQTWNRESKCVQNIETVGVEKSLCKVGSEHVDRCAQRNPITPYSPDVAPSDYHLFGKLKESLRGTRFEGDHALITAAKWWPRLDGPEFYPAGIQAIVLRWRKAVDRNGDYVEE
jgi:hypothetical protein